MNRGFFNPAQINIFLGWVVVVAAAAAGTFLSVDIRENMGTDSAVLASWAFRLSRSAHAHTNLFGMLHILFGITESYSALPDRFKMWQTLGLTFGTLAMSVGLLIQSQVLPEESGSWYLEIMLGALLSASLLAMFSHCYGILLRMLVIQKREDHLEG